jgi:hypothetical protein
MIQEVDFSKYLLEFENNFEKYFIFRMKVLLDAQKNSIAFIVKEGEITILL